MKIIDERGRLFGRISVIDVIAAAAAIVILIAGYMKFNVIETISPSVSVLPVQYTVEIKNIRDTNAKLILPGDKVWTDTNAAVGTVVSVEIVPAAQLSRLVDGTYVIGEIEGKVDVYVTIEAGCSNSNGRRYIDRTFDLSVNREDRFRTKYQSWTGTIYSISETGNA